LIVVASFQSVLLKYPNNAGMNIGEVISFQPLSISQNRPEVFLFSASCNVVYGIFLQNTILETEIRNSLFGADRAKY
jgi:hypothetical protein